MSGSLHIHNSRIWTGDAARPWASSITIEDGLVVALDRPLQRHFSGAVIDARQNVVTPGLIDAHLHLLKGAASMKRLDLSNIRSQQGFEEAIAREHARLPAGSWLIAWGWSQENWPGRRMPSKHWLRAAHDRPTVCYRMDMHAAVVNDAVLQLCALEANPPGGQIQRDASNEPTGLMIEAAAWQIINPLVPEPTIAERRAHLLSGQRHLHSLGLTSVNSMEYQRDVQDVYEPLRQQLTLRCAITLLDRDWPLDVSYGQNFAHSDSLRIIGYKAFLDGTLGSHTARMLHEYADRPGNRGMFVELAADGHLFDWACFVAAAGFSPSMHAIGDEAARLALDVVDAIGVACRPRIEHAQQLDPADIPRFAGRIASMQPLHKADDCRYVRQRLHLDRISGTFAFRSLQRAGAILAFGSDWPVVSADPMRGIQTAVTGLLLNGERFGERENLTVAEAFRAYTAGAAFALGMDNAGVLRPGALGDLTLFDRDPFALDWNRELPVVAATIVGGNVVYDAPHSC